MVKILSPERGTRPAVTPGRLLLYLFLIAGSVGMVSPLFWMLSTALKANYEVFTIPPGLLPREPQWQNLAAVWADGRFARYFLNTLVVSVATTFVTLAITSMAGYAFAKFRFLGRQPLFFFFLGTMMIPMQVTMIPVFLLEAKLGLLDSYLGLILPLSANAFGVFLMRQFMMTLPDELIEAARMDGAGELRIYGSIVLPLVRPALATLGILTFLNAWNEFLWPLILMDSDEMMTLQVALTQFQGQYDIQWNLLMAASFLSILPILFLFLAFQRNLVEGIAMTGLKA